MSGISYMEIAKECPKCLKMTLFLKFRIKKIDFHHYKTILGVGCTNKNCNYEADLVRILKDD